jgi:hypothetical protein
MDEFSQAIPIFPGTARIGNRGGIPAPIERPPAKKPLNFSQNYTPKEKDLQLRPVPFPHRHT